MDDELHRLQRRLDRERATRRESELVAERSLRRLYSRQRALSLLTSTAEAANDAPDDVSALTHVMTLIRDEYEWPVAHLLLTARDDPSVMVSSGHWVAHEGDPFAERIRTATKGLRFPPGVGVPGLAAQTGPRWDAGEDSSLLAPRLEALGAGTVFAFPIKVGETVAGVLEFLSEAPRPRDPDLLELGRSIGVQVGRAIERTRTQLQLRQQQEQLEQTVRERTSDLLRARDRAEALGRARSALFNAVSHDLSTPVHAARAALQAAQPDLATALAQLDTLQQHITALMEVAAAPAPQAPPRVTSLPDLIEGVCSTHQQLLRNQGGDLTLLVEPSAAEDVLIDIGLVTTALDSLIASLQLADPSTTLQARLKLVGSYANIEVRHDGPPAEPSSLALATRACSDAHGSLTHPQADRYLLSIPVSRPSRQRRGQVRRVLLVDDTTVTQRLAGAMLADAGLPVEIASNGQEAIDQLRQSAFGVVLMDVRMPVLDGLSATRLIRSGSAGADRCEVPIVGLTAESAPGSAEEGLLAGMDAYILKPFSKDELISVASRYLPE